MVCTWCNDYGLVQDQDFGPEYCDRCERDVIKRNPRNGWRSYFLSDPEYPDDGQCCVACFQDYIFENGVPRERFEDRRVFCDFFSWEDLTLHGYERHETYSGLDIAEDPDKFCDEMIMLIDQGYKIALDQGATGIGNSYPDSVDVWVKR